MRISTLVWLLSVAMLAGALCSCHSTTSDQQADYDVAAFYWPNYHDEPRLEFIFPEGIGEWETIREARPKDSLERQPRVPLWGYEDESDTAVMSRNIAQAVSHGVNVFIFDWYWYDNQPLLERCLDSGFLRANHDRMKFYVMWANHDATTYWDVHNPRVDSVYWKGSVDMAIFKQVVHRVITRYFKQPSYYQIDGKPVFSLYDLNNFVKGMGGADEARAALDYFRDETRKAGFPGLYLQAILWSSVPKSLTGVPVSSVSTQDKVLSYFGFNSFTNYTWAHLQRPDGDYERWADSSVAMWPHFDAAFSVPFVPNVTVGWDANPRFLFRTSYVSGSTPEKFKAYLTKARDYVDAHPDQPRLITINAWNEWSEGSYLQPDTTYGMGYLEAVKAVFGAHP